MRYTCGKISWTAGCCWRKYVALQGAPQGTATTLTITPAPPATTLTAVPAPATWPVTNIRLPAGAVTTALALAQIDYEAIHWPARPVVVLELRRGTVEVRIMAYERRTIKHDLLVPPPPHHRPESCVIRYIHRAVVKQG